MQKQGAMSWAKVLREIQYSKDPNWWVLCGCKALQKPLGKLVGNLKKVAFVLKFNE